MIAPRCRDSTIERSLVLALAVVALASPVSLAAAAEPVAPRTIAEALRMPGELFVVDCGEGAPNAALADKMADDLRPIRDRVPRRVHVSQLAADDWRSAHLIVVTDDADEPLVTAVAKGLGLHVDPSRLSLAGLDLEGEAAALVVLPHPQADDRWVMLIAGTSAGALHRLDRRIRNDVVAPLMIVDDAGVRLAELVQERGRWTVAEGHPYDPDVVRQEAATWVLDSGSAVSSWDGNIQVDTVARELVVDVQVSLERPRWGEGGPGAWLTLNPLAEIEACEGPGVRECVRHDARDGRMLIRVSSRRHPTRVHLRYRLRLEQRLEAWYLGPAAGYVMPEANWLPRVRGGADEPFLERAPYDLEIAVDTTGALVAGAQGDILRDEGAGTPALVWGRWRLTPGQGSDRLYVALEAPDEVAQRARDLADTLRRQLPGAGPFIVAAAARPTAWYGDGLLVAPPDLLEPRPVDDVDQWLLQRLRAQHLIRLGQQRGQPVSVTGRAVSLGEPVTVRLWRLRGSWWQQLDEGPVTADGSFVLEGTGGGELMVTAEAPGQVPLAVALDGVSLSSPLYLALTPIEDVVLECLRCGIDLDPVRFPMEQVEAGHFRAVLALDASHRRYGSFPYAFDLGPGDVGVSRVLDGRRSVELFPSFLTPEEFHGDEVTFDLWVDELRFWIELPGALLAPAGWITPAQETSVP